MTRALPLEQPLRPRPPAALGGPVVHLDSTGSTNDVARSLALAGAPSGTAVLAEEQTAGRGRQGRSWSAPRGRSLTLSIVHRTVGPSGELELLPLILALAVCDACDAAGVRCGIKWPNDVWAGERKLAGILIETRPQDGWAVIGIGLNVNTGQDELDPSLHDSATSLRIASGAAVERAGVLDSLLAALAARLGQLRDGERVALLDAYAERDVLRGRRISWSGGSGGDATGEAGGIDERGNLIVWASGGERLTLSAGEVHLSVD
jgi:BirA family transcriptional regulator, biotin operon repressor / biotin---[acetyl-CoA-carboxylase] ligase